MSRPTRTLPHLLTIAEVAELEGVSQKTIHRRIRKGELPIIRDGVLIRIEPADYEAWRRARRVLLNG